jgi:hypothetical protein
MRQKGGEMEKSGQSNTVTSQYLLPVLRDYSKATRA